MQQSGIIYIYQTPKAPPKTRIPWQKAIGIGLLAISLGGIIGPFIPAIRLESQYYVTQAKDIIYPKMKLTTVLPPSVPIMFNPLKLDDGTAITPVNRDFSLIIPKIGVNAPIIAAVNPASPDNYLDALQKGVAHASTSYFPNEDGTVYLFSHSTNYDWFVKDLNAVFYLLKNLSQGDIIVVFYKQKQYVYRITEKRIVKPSEISYLVPQKGNKRLILQTCWPPGSTTERLLLFADVLDDGKLL